jgi:FMN phosphatase YigB (HAD superfamily)
MDYKTIIFDFDGVLCHDHFYTNLATLYPSVFEFIESTIFENGSEILNKWMRGQITKFDINSFISSNTGIDIDVLNRLFIESVNVMRIDQQMLDLAKSFSQQGKNIALVTNNVDVFTDITVKRLGLDKVFPVIINSHNYRLLKNDENGKLYDITITKLGVRDYQTALLIDDSSKAREVFSAKGGGVYAYKTYNDLILWLKNETNLACL